MFLQPTIAPAEPAGQPNIVLLISDDDDHEHFGFMGSEIAQTPTLDTLAAAGTVFTTAYCPAPLCRPSLASMLSGRMPHQHGIYGNYLDRGGPGNDTIKLDPAGSLPKRLSDAGYATYATGKYWEGDAREMGFTHGAAEASGEGFRRFVRGGQQELFEFIDEQGAAKPMFIWWAPLIPHTPQAAFDYRLLEAVFPLSRLIVYYARLSKWKPAKQLREQSVQQRVRVVVATSLSSNEMHRSAPICIGLPRPRGPANRSCVSHRSGIL